MAKNDNAEPLTSPAPTVADAAGEPASQFVEVSSKTTNRIQVIPREWLDHPELGKDFELTPSQKAAEHGR